MNTHLRVISDLRGARGLIADPANWIQGSNHRVIGGRDCYCLNGAITVASNYDQDRAWWAYDALKPETGQSPVAFNDCHSHPEVVAALDDTIARLEQEATR